MNEISKRILLPLGLAAFGIIILVVSFIKLGNIRKFPKTTSTISRIEKEQEFNSDNNEWEDVYTAYVKYEVDGKEYEAKLDEYKSSFKEGTEVKIAYNPDKPTEVYSTATGIIYVAMAIGGVMSVIGIVLLGAFLFFAFKKK